MILDHEARESILKALHHNMVVDASAGSGKTQSLALRMARGIIEGVYEPGAMAAVTFTRKAASELRGRLQLVLEDSLRQETCLARRERAKNGLAQLESIYVGTIHSFCARLLREYPVEAGLSPGFQQMEDQARTQMLSTVYRRVFQEAAESVPDSFRALNQGEVRRLTLLSALNTVCQNPEVHFPAPIAPPPDLEEVWTDLALFAREMKARLPGEPDPEATCKLQKLCYRLLRQVEIADRSRYPVLLGVLGDWTKELKVTQKNWPGDGSAERKRNALAALDLAQDFVDETVTPFFRRWRAHLYGHCMVVLKRTKEEFESVRHGSARLDYGDLLHQAARLLRTTARVRRALSFKFRRLFVDEFQDTDPLQAEVLLLLAAEFDCTGSDWTEAPLRPGALFVVGDPKQSIYRFRRADIGVYEFVKERVVAGGGLCVTLTTSFRSTPSVCAFTNRVFSHLFPAQSGAVQAAYDTLQPVREDAAEPWNGVYVLTDHTEKKLYGNVSANEAPRIARIIREAVSNGDFRWGDFLILTEKKKQVLDYAAALEELHIPVESSGGYPADSHWLQVVRALLFALTDPHDPLRTVGVLKGPLFGLSDQDLFAHKQAGGRFSLLGVDERSPGHPSVVGALLTLQSFHALSKTLPAGAGIEKILEDSGVLALASCRDPGDGEVPALLQLADSLRSMTLQGRTLAQALRDLEVIDQTRPVSLNAGREDVVRVMNLHQSKGLQSRVVFLAAPTDGAAPQCDVRIERDGQTALGALAVRAYNPFGGVGELLAAPEDWERHEQAELSALQAEKTRLLYVAATRARDVLVVSRWVHQHGRVTPAWEGLQPFLNDVPELPWPTGDKSVAREPVTLHDANEATLDRASRWSRCRRPGWERRSVALDNQPKRLEWKPWDLPVDRVNVGPAWGDLVHRLLEHAVRGPGRDEEHLARLANWFVFEQPELQPLVPVAVQTVMGVMRTEFWRKVVAGKERLVEVPFGIRSGNTLMFGVLDLITKTSQAWQIVDYKTDVSPMDHLVRKYSGQVVPYAEHWTAITGETVDFAGIFRVRSEETSEDLRG